MTVLSMGIMLDRSRIGSDETSSNMVSRSREQVETLESLSELAEGSCLEVSSVLAPMSSEVTGNQSALRSTENSGWRLE